MYFKDNDQHKTPHIHARYGGEKASFDLVTGELLAGSLPPKQTKFVQTWIMLRQEDLATNWDLALNNEQPYRIEPLK